MMKFFALIILLLISPRLWAVDQPDGCWKNPKVFPCAYRATEAQWVNRGDFKLFMGQGSSILLGEARRWQILQGEVWVEKADGWKLSQLGRGFEIEGQAWIVKDSEKLTLRVFQGGTKVDGRTSTEVPAGFENWWTLAGEGVLQPMPNSMLTRWNRWLHLPKDEAAKKIRLFSGEWKGRVDESADLYQEVLQRRIASVEGKEEAKYQRHQQALREQAKMRRMFRDRYKDGR